jgi:hypothetical protein
LTAWGCGASLDQVKLYCSIAPFALALTVLALAGGPATASGDTPCAHTDVVFYSLDSQALAQQLGAAPSACADYWISVAPYTAGTNTGKPKFLPAGPVIHAQGPQFHALAEIHLKAWCATAATSGWYATGQMLHDWMLVEGFDPARDAWAVNEVGVPSDDSCQTAIFGDESARRNFQQFVHGLYDGYPGEAPIDGVVFAASPAQLAATDDVASYHEGLAAWYADAPFWQDMDRYVRFWAQEAYADSRAWGVDGASLADRTAYLNDYFMHGRRLAAGDGDAAALAFFEHAYTPIGNASWKQPAPTPVFGPGYGETDNLTAAAMKSFISAQTYALRSWIATRFGFAVVPKNAGTDRVPLEGHLAAAIRASESDPGGACSVAPCDTVVDGAGFAEAWQAFASKPAIVSHVDGPGGLAGWYVGDVTVNWTIDGLDSPLSTLGCDTATVDTDTTGTTLECAATNRGGTSTSTVTVMRDTTPPAVTCRPTPSILWPPDNKLVPVSVDVTVSDATSGPGGFVLTGAPGENSADFAPGTPDVAGMLRATRAGNEGDRVYTLTYKATDAAGNTSTCVATVTAPHDHGN